MNCRNMSDGRCTLDLFGGVPSLGVCSVCDKYDGPPRGAGDVIHAIASATGIEAVVNRIAGDGCGCAARRAALNAAVPFSDER
jgi:hypothetical protein